MSCALLFTQGSAPLKPADVAAMVNHRNRVGYGGIIVPHDADQEACLLLAVVLMTPRMLCYATAEQSSVLYLISVCHLRPLTIACNDAPAPTLCAFHPPQVRTCLLLDL